jgi:hypothetical protein
MHQRGENQVIDGPEEDTNAASHVHQESVSMRVVALVTRR